MHSKAIFKTYNDYIPDVCKQFSDDHEEQHGLIHRIDDAVKAATKGAAAAGGLVSLIEEYATVFEKHLRGEEDHAQGMPRKYLPIEVHKQILRACWEMTPAETWRDYIPFVLNNLPMLQQRVRFIKTFLWAMPERGQHIGIMVALGVDEVQWARITAELPEIIPRGAQGWERYY